MAFSNWLQKTWEEQRPNIVWWLLCLMAAVLTGIGAVLTQGLTGWQQFGVIAILALFLIWAVAATIAAARLRSHLPRQVVTVKNVEEILVGWIQRFRFANRKLPDDPSRYYFSYLITLPIGLEGVMHFDERWS